MKTIYKYEIQKLRGVVELQLPRGARILSIQAQCDSTQVWAEVHSENELHTRRIYVVGAGHPMPIGVKLEFLGTVQHEGGALVFHFFEELVA